MRVRHTAVLLALLAIATGALSAGCTPRQPSITSLWPRADSEATITAPPGLVRYPLTGLSVPDGSVAATVPACVKVRGSAPLSGVSAADVVYETGDAAAGSQLACLFATKVPAAVGPVGPAGMPDLWIVPQYRAMLFSSAASPNILASMKGWPRYANSTLGVGDPFDLAYTGGSGGTVRGRVVADLADRFASTVTSVAPARLQFSASDDASASPISSLSVPFSASYEVEWGYDSASGRYRRSIGGRAQSDALLHARITARNVVVMWARYSAMDLDESSGGGFDVTLGGSGQASVFRDGVRYDGRWKADGDSPPTFTALDGSAIRLAPGNTWIEAIPLSANISMQ